MPRRMRIDVVLGIFILQVTAFAAIFWAQTRAALVQGRKDVNGIGANERAAEGKAERRWKHMIATQIETSSSLDEAKEHAKLLKEDAWADKR
jgi:hypothetical protein